MYHNNFFTDEQWECIRVCVANAPIPYDITKKKIPAEILAKIGQPKRVKEEGIPMVKYDLTPYGILTMNNIGLEVVFWTVLALYLLTKLGVFKK